MNPDRNPGFEGTHAQRPVIDVHSKKMPKKFKGENTKASVAKEKKAAARNEADEKKRREEEDAYWKDDDKQVARKQERMVNIIMYNYSMLCIINAPILHFVLIIDVCISTDRTRA